MSLLNDVHELQQRYADAGRYERMALDMAASLLEHIEEISTGAPPKEPTLWKVEDYLDLPEAFEMKDFRIVPKRWKMRADVRSETEVA